MTRFVKLCTAVMLLAVVSACSPSGSATRAAMPNDVMLGGYQPDIAIDSFTVSVPRSLKVNERHRYYPFGDIVWRGDPIGDRHAQVARIFETSLQQAAPNIIGSQAVRLDVQVLRFHALSEKARYSVGGVHDIDFQYRLVDVATGQQIGQTKQVQADLAALAGAAAIAADGQGQSQKTRIINHLTHVFITEFTQPGGHVNARLGLLQSINNL